MTISDNFKEDLRHHFGYSQDEIEEWIQNPRNLEIMKNMGKLLGYTIVYEVIKAHGCNSQHKVGDRFFFDGAGNLLTKYSPKKCCIYALAEMDKAIFAAGEMILAGQDPCKMKFKEFGCFDVGVKCGGWGNIVLKVSFEKRRKLR